MNKELNTVLNYRETTKHHQHRYAKSLGYMDWDTQPDPFRTYKESKKVELPLSLNCSTPAYHLLDEKLPDKDLDINSISKLFQFSMGIAAWKSFNGSTWAVRCNASSGNLHPTEAYIILPPVLDKECTVSHYAPKDHSLEILATFKSNFFDKFKNKGFLVALSSIAWREAWKYGERAFRYVQLDAGHAWEAINVSAKLLGWKVTRLENIEDKKIAKLLGLDQKNRFFEDESPDILLFISKEKIDSALNIDELLKDIPQTYKGIANKLSPSMHDWKIISIIDKATSTASLPREDKKPCKVKRYPTKEAKDVILNRRSVHIMDKEKSFITKDNFHTILNSISCSLDRKKNSAHLAIFIHRVKGYKQGLYILLREEDALNELKNEFKKDFFWEETEFNNLYLLKLGNFTNISKIISCNQDIASDGSFSMGMLCKFYQELEKYGTHRYKELYWECGMIGQQLYLEATSLGLSGTGIGCFLDDNMHQLLGLKNNKYQILYHFTVGIGYTDSRIQTIPAYKSRD